MTDSTPEVRTDLTPTQARSIVANAHRNDHTDLLQLHKANLACSNLDSKIRVELRDAVLDPVHIGHLVGLLLMESGVPGAWVTRIEKLAREAMGDVAAARRVAAALSADNAGREGQA